MLYLDNAATSYKKPKCFYKAMSHAARHLSVNAGRGGHSFSVEGAKKIAETSEKLCSLFNVSNPERIAFSQNATLSLNFAISGILKNGGHAVITQMEHNSVLRPVHNYGNYTVVQADSLGRINPDDVRAAICKDTKLVICTHASNVCGTVEPISEIAKAAHDFGAFFLLDAAQTAGCMPISIPEAGIDMLAFSAHKGLLGPLGLGGLYVREGIELSPIVFGGTGSFSHLAVQPSQMPDLLQSGTVNTPAIAALGKSIDYIQKITPAVLSQKQQSLAYMLIENLKNMKKVTVYGITSPNDGDRNGTVLFNIENIESGTLSELLNNDFKIAARGGWHCAYPAHCALGSEKSGGLRVSFGAFSNKKSVRILTDAIYKICK